MARHAMLVLEHKLGLRPDGLMRLSDLSKHPVWLGLLADIEQSIFQKYAEMSHTQMRNSPVFASDVERLAKKHGPQIWSQDLEQRDQLLTRAAINNHNGHYPQDLYWSNPEHKEIILVHLRELVIEKVVNYRASEKQWWNRTVTDFNASPIGDPIQERGFDQLFNGDEAQEAGDFKNEDRGDTPNQS
ncbi:hypothetical protein HII31_06246 [Pseudocercospora fuligena]|uniref:Uncharacterized protein n=1 Tax=Pseudocercospora fuligena TaxID=685502 RepID=A0A8H6RJL4_9PEZI|nr:hypothetical protein HII31_06246 [Pseudocercospora fuligena]